MRMSIITNEIHQHYKLKFSNYLAPGIFIILSFSTHFVKAVSFCHES